MIHSHRLIRFILYALLIFTPLARAAVQGWAVSVIHILTLIALTVFLADKSLRWEWKWLHTPLDRPMLALLCLCFAAAVFSRHRLSSFQTLILLLDYVIWFYLLIHTIRTRDQVRQVIYLIMGMGIFLSVFGLFKLGGMNPFPWWEYPELGSAGRLTASFGNPDHLAGYMEMAIPLTLGFFITGIKEGKQVLTGFALVLMFTALIFSLSRGGWIGMLCSLYVMGLVLLMQKRTKYRKLLVTAMTIFLPLMLLVLSAADVAERIRSFEQGTEMPSFDARLSAWKGAVNMILDYPLLGSGPGTFACVYTQYQPPGLSAYYNMAHNDYLHFTAETGLMLPLIMLWMMYAFYRALLKKMKDPSRLGRGTALGSMCGITAILVHSIGDFNLHVPANALLFACLAALGIASVSHRNGSHSRQIFSEQPEKPRPLNFCTPPNLHSASYHTDSPLIFSENPLLRGAGLFHD
ncbi:MAG: O-antigen ligase family protein [Desulfococcaceae bacterium]